MFRLFNLRRLKQLAAVSAIAILAACGSDDDETSADRNVEQQAQADPQFSILVEFHAIDRVLLPAPAAQPAAVAGPLPKFLH